MRRRRKFWTGVLVATLLALAMAHVYRPVIVEGWSMWPTLRNRQMVLMDRYAASSLHRGDIVVFRYGGDTYIKRVCAVGGDVLEFAHTGSMTTLLLANDPATRRYRQAASEHPLQVHIDRIRIPRGYVYVLGDNRPDSMDSRDFGPVPLDSVRGGVVTPGEAVRRFPRRLIAMIPSASARQRHGR